MSELWSLVFSCVAGVVLGIFFFGGLWWTVRKAVTAKIPALWFLGSMLLRTGVVLIGFYFVMGDDWKRLLVGLLGFIVARLVVIRHTRVLNQSGLSIREASHAP